MPTTPEVPDLPAAVLSQFDFVPYFMDNFDTNLSNWSTDSITNDTYYRTGNEHLDPGGAININKPWNDVPGLRWSADYSDHIDKTAVVDVVNKQLELKAHLTNEPNPYRLDFVDKDGINQQWSTVKTYAPALVSADRVKVAGTWRVDHSKPVMLVPPGSYIEVRVNVEDMKTGGFRWSFWGVGYTLTESTSASPAAVLDNLYDGSTENGVEMDQPELENPSRNFPDFGYQALIKYVGGAAGDTNPQLVHLLNDHGIDLRTGWHTFGTLRNADGSTVWYVDGVEVNSDSRPDNTWHAYALTREYNSGVESPPDRASRDYIKDRFTGLTSAYGLESFFAYYAAQHEIDALQSAVSAYITANSGVTMLEGVTRPGVNTPLRVPMSDGTNINGPAIASYPGKNIATHPKKPHDAGLTVMPGYHDRDLMATDVVLVDHVRVWLLDGSTTPPDPTDEPTGLILQSGIVTEGTVINCRYPIPDVLPGTLTIADLTFDWSHNFGAAATFLESDTTKLSEVTLRVVADVPIKDLNRAVTCDCPQL